MRILSILLIVFGTLGTASQYLMILEGDTHRAISGFALFIGFIVLGLAGKKFHATNYKGGASSIIGAVLLCFGIVKIILELEEYGISYLDKAAVGGLIFSLLCIVGGIFLLRSGHKIHMSRTTR